jgi:hypothetical protein
MNEEGRNYTNLETLLKTSIKDLEKHEVSIKELDNKFNGLDKEVQKVADQSVNVMEWKEKVNDAITPNQLQKMYTDIIDVKSEIVRVKTFFGVLQVLIMILVALMGTGAIDIKCKDSYQTYNYQAEQPNR